MIFLQQWHELLTWSDLCGDTQWICAFVWLEIWRISTLKEVSKRITLIRKLESDWAVARGKKSYLWIQLSAGYLCPGVSKRAQNGQPTPPPDWNGWDISSALTAPLSLEWRKADPKIPWKMMKRELLGYSFSLPFPAFCSLFGFSFLFKKKIQSWQAMLRGSRQAGMCLTHRWIRKWGLHLLWLLAHVHLRIQVETTVFFLSSQHSSHKKKLDVLCKRFLVDLILIYITLEVSRRAVLLIHRFTLIGNSVPWFLAYNDNSYQSKKYFIFLSLPVEFKYLTCYVETHYT